MPNNKDNENEQRCYFRVDDVISVVANPANIDHERGEKFINSFTSSKAFSLMDDSESTEQPYEDGTDNKKMYDMIAEIKTKLDFMINHFVLEKEGLLSEDKKSVNISASGIRFTVNTPAQEGDLMKIKLLLPTYPPVAVFAYGAVKRVKELDNATYEISLEYLNMNDSVRKEIIQYTLSYQRETIKKFKESPDTK
jgi:uncharacterized protein YfkK (UPF0435 family)